MGETTNQILYEEVSIMKSWAFIPLFIILLIGFVGMSLILFQGLDFIKQIAYNFINIVKELIR